jgi:acyl dehydratase
MFAKYLEDFVVGQAFGSGHLRISHERIKSFAAEFDPQPFHLDEAAARSTIFHGLAASGWHTAAVTMRLLVESEFRPAGGIVGAGFDEIHWPHPVRPGDELHIQSEVLEVRPSKSHSDRGLIKLRTTTLNQNGEAVQVAIGNLLVPRRPRGRSEHAEEITTARSLREVPRAGAGADGPAGTRRGHTTS